MKVIGLAIVACFVGSFVGGCGGCGHESADQPDAACLDEDGDGITTCAGDCDDTDALTLPGGFEVCGDAKDNTCDGQADEGCGGIGTFVAGDPAKGNDANPGTQASPVATIAQGMANAQMLMTSTGNPQSVFVAQGHYPEAITLVEKISLRGGYDCTAATCTWTRNPIAFDTAILNPNYEGILADNTITKATVVDGFRIVGHANNGTPPGTNGTNCMTLNGASPKITNNIFQPAAIQGAAANNNRSVGVRIVSPTADPTGVLIDGNLFTGAAAQDASAGILFAGPGQTAVATISNNVINGGVAPRSRGIDGFSSSTTTLISRNIITSGVGGGGDSWGIQLGGAGTIDANQINTDQTTVGTCSGANWCGGIDVGAATLTVTNNIVYGMKAPRSAAARLRDFEATLGTVTLNSNYLDGAGNGPTVGTSSQSAALVLSVAGGQNVFVGKVRNNILIGGSNGFRFGVFEDPNQTNMARQVHTEAFENNDIFFFRPAMGNNDALYRLMSSGQPGTQTLYTTVQSIEGGAAPITIKNNGVASGNQSADPQMDMTFHIAGTSPCVNMGTATEAPATDFEGNARPAGAATDIGHDETP